uniref:Uncharacterized protein n=1 Tax=Strongyloides papillosus TaxID=174720 RepID=A0A0N5C5J1_STREA
MKYLISFIILAIVNSKSLIETRTVVNEASSLSHGKWELYQRRGISIKLALDATNQYNIQNLAKYRFSKLLLAEKAVQPPLKIRVFYIACAKTSKKNSGKKGKNKNSKKGKKTCDKFRATFERDLRTQRPTISVRKLTRREHIKPSNPAVTQRPKTTKKPGFGKTPSKKPTTKSTKKTTKNTKPSNNSRRTTQSPKKTTKNNKKSSTKITTKSTKKTTNRSQKPNSG